TINSRNSYRYPIDLNAINEKFYRILRQFEPFGPGNMSPVFMSDNLKDTGYGKCVGEDKTHLRLTVKQEGTPQLVCIGFGLGNKLDVIKSQQPFKAAYSVDENHWQGNVSLQLKLQDIKA